jgi:hypothetical protein
MRAGAYNAIFHPNLAVLVDAMDSFFKKAQEFASASLKKSQVPLLFLLT